jgi:hypothetical protein
MRLTFKTLLLLSTTLGVTAAFAEPPARLDIPFSLRFRASRFQRAITLLNWIRNKTTSL